MRRFLAALAPLLLLALPGCVKEISSEDRLDRETRSEPIKDAVDGTELAKVNCQDTQAGLAKARNESRPETDRLVVYTELFESLKKRVMVFDEAMSRNPDLAYQEGSQELVAAKEVCIQQSADVRMEFERYVRELVSVPTVQEIKGGSSVTAARIDFATLREAIESLSPDDKEQLLSRVSSAEKKVEVTAPVPRKKGR
ncbi:MAG: hypothetical protein ACYC8T_33530 [Myxococcaceae bacterium]